MKNTIEYWKKVKNPLPENAFDFISIHPHWNGGYRLISPLCIVESDEKRNRPQWEQDRFHTTKQAVRAANMIAALTFKEIRKKIFVLFCPD